MELYANVMFDRETGVAWIPNKYDDDGNAVDWAPTGWTFIPTTQSLPIGQVRCPYSGFATQQTAQDVIRLMLKVACPQVKDWTIKTAEQNTIFPYSPAPPLEIHFTTETGKKVRRNAGLLADSFMRSGFIAILAFRDEYKNENA